MLAKEVIKELIQYALQEGSEFIHIFEEEKQITMYQMVDGKVEKANIKTLHGIGFRIIQGCQSVYGYTNTRSVKHMKETIKKLQETFSNRIQHEEDIVWNDVQSETKHRIKKHPKAYTMQEKIAVLKEASDAAYQYHKWIKNVTTTYKEEIQKVCIANSEGTYRQGERVHIRLAVQAIAKDNDNIQDGSCAPGAAMGFEFFDVYQPTEIGRQAAEIACNMLHAQPCMSKTMDVVIDHGFGGVIFHEACGHSLEAAAVAKQQSIFAGKIGQKVASEKVTLVDDGTIVNAWGSSDFDDEGVATRRNVLIEKGILKGYMNDYVNAKRMGVTVTGNARCESYHYEPISRMTNTFIENGDCTKEEIIANTKYGLFAKHMGGGSVDPSTGDFNFAVTEAYLIEDGKITKPLKGATLIGNGAKTLLQIDMVANNLKQEQGICGASSGWIPTNVGQPTIRVKGMIVGGRSGEDTNE